MTEKKIISVDDYLRDRDRIEDIEVGDFVMQLRICRPSPEDSSEIAEAISQLNAGDLPQVETEQDFADLPVETQSKMVNFINIYNAMLMSSCVFYPDMSEKKRVWTTWKDAMSNNDIPLFGACMKKVGDFKAIIGVGEAKK